MLWYALVCCSVLLYVTVYYNMFSCVIVILCYSILYYIILYYITILAVPVTLIFVHDLVRLKRRVTSIAITIIKYYQSYTYNYHTILNSDNRTTGTGTRKHSKSKLESIVVLVKLESNIHIYFLGSGLGWSGNCSLSRQSSSAPPLGGRRNCVTDRSATQI